MIGLIFNVVLNLVFVPAYGFIAAAAVTAATEATVLALSGWVVLRQFGLPLASHRLSRTAAAAALMAVVVMALNQAGVPITGLVAAGSVVYAGALVGLRAISVADLQTLVGRESP